MQDPSDIQLLRAYADQGDDPAFGGLVARYTDLVYAAALRQVESPDIASDLTQAVFLDLARKADEVGRRMEADRTITLAGWLHRATRFASLNHVRAARRRAAHEREAMDHLLDGGGEPAPDWEVIRPILGTRVVNGSTVIQYRGGEQSIGPTEGPVMIQQGVVKGRELAAVFDGSRVVWESVPGAAREMKGSSH